VRLLCLGGLGGRPHTQGLARWLSCFVATFVASSISEASAKLKTFFEEIEELEEALMDRCMQLLDQTQSIKDLTNYHWWPQVA
jgi:hypothetical protein